MEWAPHTYIYGSAHGGGGVTHPTHPGWTGTPAGDPDLAARLLFEHGLDPGAVEDWSPEEIEIMAAVGGLDGDADYCLGCGWGCDEGARDLRQGVAP